MFARTSALIETKTERLQFMESRFRTLLQRSVFNFHLLSRTAETFQSFVGVVCGYGIVLIPAM